MIFHQINIQMFTMDLALAYGDPEYKKLSEEAANLLANLTRFWYGWHSIS